MSESQEPREDEVEGHKKSALNEDESSEAGVRAARNEDGAEVEGHKKAAMNEDDEPEVEGHLKKA